MKNTQSFTPTYTACFIFTAMSQPILAQSACPVAATAQLSGADAASNEWIGRAITINDIGNQIAFGSPGHDHVGTDAGAVYVFCAGSAGWQQTAEILPTGAFPGMVFGWPVAFNGTGDVLAVSATGWSLNPPHLSSVTIYRLTAGTWVEESRLVNMPNPISDYFGYSLAVDDGGERIVVGCPQRTSPSLVQGAGSVYVFHATGGMWIQEALLFAADGTDFDNFGSSVDISAAGDVITAGAPSDDGSGGPNSRSGSVYVFKRNGTAWSQSAKLTMSIPYYFAELGSSVSIDSAGTTILAGCLTDSQGGYQAGSALVFRCKPNGWLEQTKLLAPNSNLYDNFGQAVALSAAGDFALISAPGSQSGSGSVYSFLDQGAGWQPIAEITSPNASTNFAFGESGIAMNATSSRWIVGAPFDDTFGTDSGTVHVFDSPCTTPVIYCTAKTNTLGCIPQIAFTGTPSASLGSGFVVSASNIFNNRLGYLFYGTNGQNAAPFKGGMLCVRQPLSRTPGQFSGGTPPPAFDCSGTLSLDFNTWFSSSNDPNLFVGQRVQAQYWSRDSQSSFGVSLTDAVDLVFAP